MVLGELSDPSRQRAIPYAFYPVGPTARGQVLFSVGYGGQRDGYGYLAREWQSCGWEVFVCQHIGSDLQRLNWLKSQPPRLRNQLEWSQRVGAEVLCSPDVLQRPADLLYLAEQAPERRSDLDLVLAGHSFGCITVLGVMGATLLVHSPAGSFSKVRLRARLSPVRVVLMSLQPHQTPKRQSLWDGTGLEHWKCPVLILTGTLDSGMPAGTLYSERISSADRFPAQYRTVGLVEQANHMDFAGVGLGRQELWDRIAKITLEYLGSGAKVAQNEGHALWDEKALEYARSHHQSDRSD